MKSGIRWKKQSLNSALWRTGFDVPNTEKRIVALEEIAQGPDFWQDRERSTQLAKELSDLKGQIAQLQKWQQELADIEELEKITWDDPAMRAAYQEKLSGFLRVLSKEELKTFFRNPYDRRPATLAVYAGAGGRDAEDWAAMLWRMYQRWCERHNHSWQTLDEHAGQEGGIKSAVAEISGQYVYGYLVGEQGVHRLVRISPFDASKQRHTSFALVEVLPKIEAEEFPIKPEDLEFEAFRSSGPGGQNVNKVETAVRIRHKSTGVVVSVQSERSQERNRERALAILRSKLHQRALGEVQEKKAELRGPKTKIEWGHQIRSYVLHPYHLVKDHRTNLEIHKVDGVLDGDIDALIESELKLRYKVEE